MKYCITIHTLAVQVAKNDWVGKNDLFVLIRLGNEIRRTTVKWNENKPIWNETFIFNSIGDFSISIHDEDSYSKSEELLREVVSVNVEEVKEFKTKYLNISHGIANFKTMKEVDILKNENEKLLKLLEDHYSAFEQIRQISNNLIL